MTAVVLEGLTKRFGNTLAVDNLSLTVAEGEFFTLLGPSGCGKTTTLRLIAGFEAPTAGVIRFGDRVVNDLPPQRRHVGMVFQNYAVFPTMTVFENVAYGLEVRGVRGKELRRRVGAALELVGLSGLEGRRPEQLSGGQLQRVALARALVIEPEILLLDEPLSNLDAQLRVSIRREIRRIQQTLKITTIYVTHDQEEALALSDRIAVLNAGRLEQVATPFELYRFPATRFVARFIGRTTVLTGEVAAVGTDGLITIRLDGGLALRAAGRRPVGPGQRVWVSVRPEALSLAGAESGDNLIAGEVSYVEFLGPVVRGELRAQGLTEPLLFEVGRPDRDWPALRGRILRFRVDPALVTYGLEE